MKICSYVNYNIAFPFKKVNRHRRKSVIIFKFFYPNISLVYCVRLESIYNIVYEEKLKIKGRKGRIKGAKLFRNGRMIFFCIQFEL